MLPKKAKDCYNAKSYPLLEPSSSSSSSSTKCLTKRKYHSTDFTNYFNISLIVIFLIALLTLDTVSSLTCKVNQYPCADGNQCVVETYLCDNEKDCEDGSDETRCSPPSFVYANFGDRFIRKGENISLSCRAVGFPTPLIRWKFNDHFITSNHSRYRNTSINGHGKLTITGVRKEDEGIYKCVAENANNSIHSNSTIKLQVSLARDSAGEKKTSRDERYSRYREDGAIIRGLPDPLTGSVPSEDAIFLRQIANNYSAPLVASYLHSRLQKTIRMIEEIRYSLKNLSTTRRLLYIMKVRQLEALDKQITSLQKIGHFNENTPIQYLIEKYILMNELIPIEFGLEEARFNSTPDDLLKQGNLISNDILIKYVSDLIKVYLRDIEEKESNGKYNELQRFTALLTKRKLEPLINLQYFWPSEHVDHDGQRIGTFDDRLPQIEFVLRQLNNTLDVFYTQFESLASQSATSPCRMNEQTTIMN